MTTKTTKSVLFTLDDEEDMPALQNWACSTISMKGIGKKRLYTNKEFDFNKIVPEPKTMDECLKEYGKKYIYEKNCHLRCNKNNKWFNWRDWHFDFWGTEYNASGTMKFDDDTIQIITDWSEPEEIWQALSKKYPTEKIGIKTEYADGTMIRSTWLNGVRLSYELED